MIANLGEYLPAAVGLSAGAVGRGFGHQRQAAGRYGCSRQQRAFLVDPDRRAGERAHKFHKRRDEHIRTDTDARATSHGKPLADVSPALSMRMCCSSHCR